MKQLMVMIERAADNYSAYIENVDGVIAVGSSIDEIKINMLESINAFIDECVELGCEIPDELKGDYELVFKMDVQSFFDFYKGIFTKSGMEKLTGINQKQLWHYASGSSKPRQEQIIKIENALHKLGTELVSVSL